MLVRIGLRGPVQPTPADRRCPASSVRRRSSTSTCATGWSITWRSSRSAASSIATCRRSARSAPTRSRAGRRDRQLAYWINAYNAFVLRTVIDDYPIRGRAADYPPNSIRQIPGAFERRHVPRRRADADARCDREGRDRRVRRCARAARARPRRHRRPAPQERSLHGGAARLAAADHGERARDDAAIWCAWMSRTSGCRSIRCSRGARPIFTKSLADKARAGLRDAQPARAQPCWR